MKRMLIALTVTVLVSVRAAAADCSDPGQAGTQGGLDSCLFALADDSAFGARRDDPQQRDTPSAATETCPDPKGTAAGPPGNYRVTGTNPDGSTYSGTVTIQREPSGSYRVVWEIGSDQFHGIGRLEGGVLTVDWGTDAPAIYELQATGTLDGTWAHGEGTELLVLSDASGC